MSNAKAKATIEFQNFLDAHDDPEGFLRAFAPVVRGFDRNQPKCSPANRVRHLYTLLSLVMHAGDVEYIVDQITQMLAHLPKVINPGYVLTRSAVVLTSDPTDDESAHVENGTQNTLLRRMRCIMCALNVCSFWIGPGRANPNGGDTSMNHYLLRGVQSRIRDLVLLKMKGDRLSSDAVDRLNANDVAALFGVSIPKAEPVVAAVDDEQPVVAVVDDDHNDEPAVAVFDDEIDPAHKHYEHAAFVPVEGQFQQPAHVVYVPVDGHMMIEHLSNEVRNLNDLIAHLTKVNNDQSMLLDYIISTHGYSGQGVQKAYSPFPIGDV